MPAFKTPVDIGNRGLQHCGAVRIDPLQGFSENSSSASEVAFAYDKLRQAELRSNVWGFACKRAALRAIDTNTMLLQPSLFSASVTYFRGCVVSDEENDLWVSRVANNTGNDPENSLLWEPYFGPRSVSLYDSTLTYNAGEVVYTDAGNGTNRTYVSLISGNGDNPATATAWSATTTYNTDNIVTRSSVAYKSLIDLSLNQDPALAPALWSSITTYAAGNKVGGSNGVIYQSVGSGNVGNDPTTDSGALWTNTGVLNPWTTVFVGGTGSVNWRQIGGAEFPMGVGLTTLDIVYPLDSGPFSQSWNRNVFMLPAGFLRLAPQIPGGATLAWLGGPRGVTYRDWVFESGYLLTSESGPITLRFVADVTDVTMMDPTFCEGLAARVGMEVCETVTQSSAKVAVITKIYKDWISLAKTQNAIEQGADEPPDDDYLTVRL